MRMPATYSTDRAPRDDRVLEDWFESFRHPFGPALTIFVFAICDLAALLASFLGGLGLVDLCISGDLPLVSFASYWPFISFFFLGFFVFGLYPGLSLAPSEEFRRFSLVSLLGFSSMIITRRFVSGDWGAADTALVTGFALSVPTLTAGRVLTRSRVAKTRWWGIPAVIFGSGPSAKLLVDRLIDCPWIGYRPVAMLDDDARGFDSYRGVPLLEGMSRGPGIAERYHIAAAIVVTPKLGREEFATLVERYVKPFRTYVFISDFAGATSIWTTIRDFEGQLGLSTSQHLLFSHNKVVKRFVELVLTVVGSILALPFIGLIALAIKIDSPGPVFFGHRRLGRGGKEFTAWKFRTMCCDAGAAFAKHLEQHPEARAEWEEKHKLTKDPRVTRVGAFLREKSLDELPQIWNVLRGEMSLIGPRPIVDEEIPKYGNAWATVSSVLPGISGLWQVSGRSDTTYDERVALDLYYIQSWSLWLDLFILFKTVWIVIAGRGAY